MQHNHHPALRFARPWSDLLHRTAKRLPHKTGIVCGATTWTWRRVRRRRHAGSPRACMPRAWPRASMWACCRATCHGFAALRFAVARLGAVLVPINFMLSAEEANYVLQHSGATVLCVDSGHADMGREAAAAHDRSCTLHVDAHRRPQPSPCAGMLSFNALSPPTWPAPPAPSATFNSHLPGSRSSTPAAPRARPKGAIAVPRSGDRRSTSSCIMDTEIADGRHRCCTHCRCTTAPNSTASSGRRSTRAPPTSSPARPRRRTS
ncbi:MAG: AMP-binding protein [Ideonella sp.]|nr:AMP-binding protein [Ideonella sp.]